MMKVLALSTFSAVLSPVMAPFSTRQNVGSPSQLVSDLPSKIGWNPAASSGTGCRGPRDFAFAASGAGGWATTAVFRNRKAATQAAAVKRGIPTETDNGAPF